MPEAAGVVQRAERQLSAAGSLTGLLQKAIDLPTVGPPLFLHSISHFGQLAFERVDVQMLIVDDVHVVGAIPAAGGGGVAYSDRGLVHTME